MLGGWWRQSDHYDWLSGYLAARGMSTPTRALMAFIVASFALCLAALLASRDGPCGTVQVAMTWVAVAGGVGGAVLWMWRWPTRLQALAFAMVVNTSIALACLAHPNPLAALTGCIAFATSGAYIAFFHPTGLVLYNLVVAAGVGLIEALRLTVAGHPALAGVDLWLVVQVNIALPLAIQILVRALGADLVGADRDPLTGLLNRRAFQHKTLGLILARRSLDAYLAVAVIDLDNFKALNDKHGHTAGDQALVHVAQALLATAGYTTVIARSGGEEFHIANTSATKDPTALAQRICAAIAASPARVTASIGTACARLGDHTNDSHQSLIDELVSAADAAMYQAKRRGGNQIHHHGLHPSPQQ